MISPRKECLKMRVYSLAICFTKLGNFQHGFSPTSSIIRPHTYRTIAKNFFALSLSVSCCGTSLSLPWRMFSKDCATSFVSDMQDVEASCHFFPESLDIIRCGCFGWQLEGATFCAASRNPACSFRSTSIIIIIVPDLVGR